MDSAAQTFTLRGIIVFYGNAPRVDNGSLADLVNGVGRSVRVRGVLSADRTRVLASRIEFINS